MGISGSSTMPSSVKVSGGWKTIRKIYRKDSGSWAEERVLWAKVDGVWKVVHSWIPSDMILMVPEAAMSHAEDLDWHLCDGTDGTPNLLSESLYVRVSSTGSLTVLGSAEHTHDSITASIGTYSHFNVNTFVKNLDANGTSTRSHSHDDITGIVTDGADNVFKTLSLRPYTPVSSIGQAIKIPSGSYFFSNIDLSASYTLKSHAGEYVRLEDAGTTESYGAATHGHSLSNLDGEETSVVVMSYSRTDQNDGGVELPSHFHTLTGPYEIPAMTAEGPYYDLAYFSPSSDLDELPVGFMTYFLGTYLPSGWRYFSEADGRYIRGAANVGAIGATGDSSTHTHLGLSLGNTDAEEDDTGSSLTGSDLIQSGNWNKRNHTHPITISASSSETITPRHIELRLLRKDS